MSSRLFTAVRTHVAGMVPSTALALVVACGVAGCAPDAYRSAQATGFNAYIQKLGQVCRPLQIGDQDLSRKILEQATGDDNYVYFIDNTSRLYYNQLSQGSYRQALVGFFGAGTYNDVSFNCIYNNLPPDRPNAPPARY
jgi:hypothetical protein